MKTRVSLKYFVADCSLCVREKIDPFWAPSDKIVNYFSTMFDEDLQYRT